MSASYSSPATSLDASTREDRGRLIAENLPLTSRRGDGPYWMVPSQTRKTKYLVDEEKRTCTCPDYEDRQEPCKHVFAVEYTIKRVTNGRGETTTTETLRLTYSQDWPAYNAAQVNEKDRVATLLRSLCSAIDNPPQEGRGRPRLPLSDAIFAAVMKVYGGTSGRRAMSDMREYAAQGHIVKAPCYNSIFNVLEDPTTGPLLKVLIEESAAPLACVEEDFASDSSGFATSTYARWYSAKYGREMAKAQWIKAHVMIGTTTNVVTAVSVTDGYVNDAPEFVPLLDRTAKRFTMKRVSADKAYSTNMNLVAVRYHGAAPYIPFKSNARTRGLNVWGRAHQFFLEHRDEFMLHYHKRSNVETTFFMIKSKFGSHVRSKTPVAQRNEVLAKVLCHNLCCLVQAAYELKIEAKFWERAA